MAIYVFVPLSGSVSVNLGSIPVIRKPKSFRPLIGVSFCKQDYEGYSAMEGTLVFVPLSGSVSVNKICLILAITALMFSSPYRGQFL